TWRRLGSQDSEQAHVVLERRDFHGSAGLDHPLDTFDVTIPVRGGKHDGPARFTVNVARAEKRQRDHVQRHSVPLAQLLGALEIVDRQMPAGPGVGGIAANMSHAVPFEIVEHLRRRWPALAADVHGDGWTGSRLGSMDLLVHRLSGPSSRYGRRHTAEKTAS